MRNLMKAVLAAGVVVLASGCVHTGGVDGARVAEAPAAPEARVIRPLPSYGSMGGYRYRRFAATGA